MATDLQNPDEQSATSLLGGIIDDLQDLIKQQLQLMRKEITHEVRKAALAAWLTILGVGMILLSVLMLCLGLTHLLHWATSPPGIDPAEVPLWACYGIVGGTLFLAGGILAWVGQTKFRAIHPLQNPATEALKDNVQWVTKRT